MTVSEKLSVSRKVNTVTVMHVDVASIDYRNAEQLKTELAALTRQGAVTLLMNVEKVTFMDSAGLGVLLFAKRQCEAQNGQFNLSNATGYLVNLFRLTNIDRAVTIFPTEESALSKLGAR